MFVDANASTSRISGFGYYEGHLLLQEKVDLVQRQVDRQVALWWEMRAYYNFSCVH